MGKLFQDIQPEKCKTRIFPPKLVRRKYNKYAVVGNTMLKCSAAILKSYKNIASANFKALVLFTIFKALVYTILKR
jgi:hypothetical protein